MTSPSCTRWRARGVAEWGVTTVPRGVYPRKPRSQEHRDALSAALKGRVLSSEHRAAVSAGLRGRLVSAETKQKLSQANTGKRHSDETRLKISEAARGRKQSEETISRRVSANRGKRRTEEFRNQMSEARKGKFRVTSPAQGSYITASGYVALTMQYEHPLAVGNSEVLEHRAVLYSEIGPGSHNCHWCGIQVSWGCGLVVDHLNGDRVDNTPENLVPSCDSCNLVRGMVGNPTDWRPNG